MTEKLTKLCDQFDKCKFSGISIIREKFCYFWGGCPETYYPLIKEMINADLTLQKSE